METKAWGWPSGQPFLSVYRNVKKAYNKTNVKKPERDDFMQKTSRTIWKGAFLPLLLMYAGFVLVRYLLALATSNYPTVYIDEFLYYSIGRSIATEGTLLYYGQPATYNYLAYPLALAPVFGLFGHGTYYFRVIQLWNIMLMSLSVFPVYGIVHTLTGKKKTALWLTGAVMLLPDFMLGQYIFSEAIIYPLFYTLMYCVLRYLKEGGIRYMIWIGILGAALYYAKPGAVVPAAAALLLFAGKSIAARSGKKGIDVLAGAAAFAAVFFAFRLVAQGLGYHGSLFSIYDIQVSYQSDLNLNRFWYAAGRYPYYFILAGGMLPLLVSLLRFPEYGKEEKQYYLLQVVCVIVTMIGTAWIVNRPEDKEIVYLRYIAMYLPLFFVFSARQGEEKPDIPARKHGICELLCYVLLAYTVVSTLVWGSTTGIGQPHDTHFLATLSVFFVRRIHGIANILILLAAGGTLYLLAGKTDRKQMSRICCIVFVGWAVLNNVMGYIDAGDNANIRLEREAAAVHEAIGDREYLHVCAPEQCDYGLDIRSRNNICRVSAREFIGNLRENKGVYVPFLPASDRGMIAERVTPDTDTMVVDENVYQCLQFSSGVSGFITEENSFRVARFAPGERIADCVMSFSRYPMIDAGGSATLQIFDEGLLSGPVTLTLEIESDTAQDMTVEAGGSFVIPLETGRNTYNIQIGKPAEAYTFSVQEDGIAVYSYSVKAGEAAE